MAIHMPYFHSIGNRDSTKQDKHPRPITKLDMTEQEFCFFQDKWRDYKNSTGIQGNHLLSELWLTMSLDCQEAGP